MDRPPLVPLHLTSLAILSPTNAPLYVRSFTSPSPRSASAPVSASSPSPPTRADSAGTSSEENDTLRHYHLSHAAVDVIEERIVMTSTPTKPADSYLGLLFCMEDMAFYGFQTTTRIRMVLSVALVDAMIKDADIVAIFRAVHHLMLRATHNPFLSLPEGFSARPAPTTENKSGEGAEKPSGRERRTNPSLPAARSFSSAPEDIRPEWLTGSRGFVDGITRIGETLCGLRA